MSLGFERAGFDVAAAVEVDPVHCATHAFNFPACKTICRSVANISGSEIRDLASIGNQEVGVVFGGAPCQGFSLIGKRALDDPRNSLVYHFVRLVGEIQPSYFVFENVRGLTVGEHKNFLEELISAFARIEYDVVTPYAVLNARSYGVPQNRQRLFLMGARRDMPQPIYPHSLDSVVTVQEAIGDLPEADEFLELRTRDWTRAEFSVPSSYARKLRGIANDADDYGYKRAYDPCVLTSSLRTAHTEKSRRRFAATQFGKTEPVSRFFKLDPNGVCNTLRAGTGSDRGAFTSPRPIHPYTPRCITNREAARLHSYPDWFRFHVTKWHGFRQIGNSVPPLLAQAVARQVILALGVKPKRPKCVVELGDPGLLEFSMADAARYYGVPDDTIPKRVRSSNTNEAVYA
nr:DNA (cytosine-5-)-methyltransferase [Ferruginivarius sediminum]